MNKKHTGVSRNDIFRNIEIKLPNVLFIVILSLLLLSAGQYVFLKTDPSHPAPIIVQKDDCPAPPTVRYRMNDYQFTHPLLLVDRLEESKDMAGLKNEVALLIADRKQAGIIDYASVYIKDLTTSDWTSVNPDLTFNPGSLAKVIIMMTYLRESEISPGLLNKKLYLDPSLQAVNQTYNEGTIKSGKSYTIKELIYYMIVKSDNYATLLLNNNINFTLFKKLFTVLGLPEPNDHETDYRLTAADYSKFMRVLYNGTYLMNENADYALSLLVQSNFNEGIVKQLPSNIKVARKFGEWGDANDSTNHQLHESGIVYIENNPYVLTVMTKGPSVQPLAQVISDVSKIVFDKMEVTQPKP